MNLVGQRFARLTVLARSDTSSPGKVTWLCRCDCGNVTSSPTTAKLRGGYTKSCGCLRHEPWHLKHGQGRAGKRTPEFIAWIGMLQRCYDSNIPRFADYGGRGIKVCEQWRHDFAAFFAHVGPRPPGRKGAKSAYSLDRIDNNGNYEPGNVRWATASEQAFNRRRIAA